MSQSFLNILYSYCTFLSSLIVEESNFKTLSNFYVKKGITLYTFFSPPGGVIIVIVSDFVIDLYAIFLHFIVVNEYKLNEKLIINRDVQTT